jgi:hypothetical protein
MANGTPETSLLDAQLHETTPSSTPAGLSSSSTPTPEPNHDIITIHPPNNALLAFQLGVGLPGAANTSISGTITPSNRGVYRAICAAESQARLNFYLYDYLLSVCVFGQIVLGAALTALGAASSNYTAIAVLGALNTGMAGMVAVLKGQGLPNRPRQNWNAWSDVREYVEERERELAAGIVDDVDPDKEVKAVLGMYHETKASVEKNRPDMYNATPGADGGIVLGNGRGTANRVSHNV